MKIKFGDMVEKFKNESISSINNIVDFDLYGSQNRNQNQNKSIPQQNLVIKNKLENEELIRILTAIVKTCQTTN